MGTTASITTRKISKSDITAQTDSLLKPLSRVRKQWDALGETDPFRAILSRPGINARVWDRAAFFQTGIAEIEGVLQTAGQLSPIQFATAMDFGCGVGRLSQALALRFDRVIGVDIAASMIQAAAQFNEFPSRCAYVHNVTADLAVLEDRSVDFVYSNMTLQHMVPSLARRYIREFFRIARPGALVIFQMPSRPRSAAWYRIKNVTPIVLSNLLWRVRTGNPEAMESYFIPEKEVKDLVDGSKGSVRFVESDHSGPPGWQSRKYFCTRNAAV
jgi:SAM-dependent methyltransferase